MNELSKTLPREPWRGGQICGEQTSYGMPGSTFCARRKGEGLFLCGEHQSELEDDGYSPRFAPGNALGDLSEPLTLSWEPWEGNEPVEASLEEIALYMSA